MTGIVIGGVAYHLGLPLPTCLLSGGLCSIAGMLPDIDSDTSRSFQECIYLAAGVSAVLLVHRLFRFDLPQDVIILSGAGMFLFVRFVVGEIVKKMTAHRGMFHSIPAAVLAGQLVFFLSAGTLQERMFKGFALMAGYLSHLILDEICSIDSTGKSLRLKKSFGTALKLFDAKRMPTTLILYTLIVFLTVTAVKGPNLSDSEEMIAQREAAGQERPGQRLADFFTDLESKAAAWASDRKTEIRQEAAEFLTRQEEIAKTVSAAPEAQNPVVQNPAEAAIRIPTPANVKRSSENRRFVRSGRSASDGDVPPAPAMSASNSLPETPYQLTTLRNAETAGEAPPRIPIQATLPVTPNVVPPTVAPPQVGSLSPLSPMGMIGGDFKPRVGRDFNLPNRGPAPLSLP